MTNADLTVMILREIRDEIRNTNERLDSTNERLDGMTQRADATNERLDKVEGALLDLAQQQRFVVRYVKAIADRDSRLDTDLADLREGVEALEKKKTPTKRR